MFKAQQSFIALDLETTGLDFETDNIIEVALVRYRDGKSTETWNQLFSPGREIKPFISHLTGIQPEELKESPVFASKAAEILEFIGDDILVAHNAHFDQHFLEKELRAAGHESSLKFLDTLLASRIAWWHFDNHRLESLVQRLGIEVEDSHRALPDAKACGEVFLLAQNVISEYSAAQINQLGLLARGSTWETIFQDSLTPWEDFELPIRTEDKPIPDESVNASLPPFTENWFRKGSPLETILPDFSARPGQSEMARKVSQNLEKGGLFVAEAGTGLGKSMAYMIPAFRHLHKHSGDRVVIATATRALQQQLWDQDIPVFQKLFGDAVKPAILKGRRNYLCLHKYKENVDHADTLLTNEERLDLMPVVGWLTETHTGDIQENPGFNMGRHQVLWNKLGSDSASCKGECTSFRKECFSVTARKRAAASNLVLINHALFFQDMDLDFALLPSYQHIIFDEAHRLPDASSAHQTRQIWFFRLRNILQILLNPRMKQLGILREMENQFAAAPICEDIREAQARLIRCEKELHKLFVKIGKNCKKKRQEKSNQILFTNSLALEFSVEIDPFLTSLEACRSQLDLLATQAESGQWRYDLESAVRNLQDFYSDFHFVTHGDNEEWAFWLEEPGNPHYLKIHAAPLDSGKVWSEKLYPWISSATFTSATLNLQDPGKYFLRELGMENALPEDLKAQTAIYPGAFDDEKQMKVFIADFLPKPNEKNFQQELDQLLCDILPDIPLGTLSLYTSIQSLLQSQKALAPAFGRTERQLLAQHVNGAFDNLVNLYRKEENACLLGTQLFWEGIDLPGKLLELLVIPKLPFPAPSDPLLKSKSDHIKAEGGNPFREIHLPRTSLALKQGMGRLIRHEKDQGVLLLLDKRILTESYGKTFTRLWNKKHQVFHDSSSLKQALKEVSTEWKQNRHG